MILDGHCSHCTLKFLALAEQHKIIILCLPPHTTHALQPCDVGAFGPLSRSYKKEVSKLAKLNVPIRKDNVLQVYSRARLLSLKDTTIKASFRKTGIHPFNSAALSDKSFAPALVTSCRPSQPLPVTDPKFISAVTVPIQDAFDGDAPDRNTPTGSQGPLLPLSDASLQAHLSGNDPLHPALAASEGSVQPRFQLTLLDIPPPLHPKATRNELTAQLESYHQLLDQANAQIAADHAQKVLMEQENGQLRMQLFLKSKDKDNSRVLTSSARVLTHPESQLQLQVFQCSERMKEVHEELPKVVTARTKRLEEEAKRCMRAEQEAKAAAEKARREAERRQKAEDRKKEKEKQAAVREAARRKRQEEKEAEKLRRKAKGPVSGRRQTAESHSFSSVPEVQAEKENTHPVSPAPLPPNLPATSHVPSVPSTSRTDDMVLTPASQASQSSLQGHLCANFSGETNFQVDMDHSQAIRECERRKKHGE